MVVSKQRKSPRLLPLVGHGQVFSSKPKFVKTCQRFFLDNLRVNVKLNIAQNEIMINL